MLALLLRERTMCDFTLPGHRFNQTARIRLTSLLHFAPRIACSFIRLLPPVIPILLTSTPRKMPGGLTMPLHRLQRRHNGLISLGADDLFDEEIVSDAVVVFFDYVRQDFAVVGVFD